MVSGLIASATEVACALAAHVIEGGTLAENAGLLNTVHNLAHYLDTMRRVRHAIRLGELPRMLLEARSLAAEKHQEGPEQR